MNSQDIILTAGIILVLIMTILIFLKVNKKKDSEKYRADPDPIAPSCGLPTIDHSLYGPYSSLYSCDLTYPTGSAHGGCINMDKGLTCQAYRAQDPTKFASVCAANVPCVTDADCSASKVYNRCAKSGRLKGTCQALDDNGKFKCGDNKDFCLTDDGSKGYCFYGGCQPMPKL